MATLLVTDVATAADPAGLSPPEGAVLKALAEWEEFAATGDIDVVGAAIATDGPQGRQLAGEAVDFEPLASPFRFVAHELLLRSQGTDAATVWGRIEATREGFVPETYSWDFDLVRRDDRWLVWSVVETDRPDQMTTATTRPPSPSTTLLRPTSRVLVQPEAAAPVAVPEPSAVGTRIPALSAWIVVVTIVGVAAAGYLAPRLERKDPG